jgi:hypothetical protein
VLTDLESTNGTRVNGEEIQLRILRFGDTIALGRSVLLYGSRAQIARRLAELRGEPAGDGTAGAEDSQSGGGSALDYEINLADNPDIQSTLHTLVPPELPERLSPGQAAQLYELLDYVHLRIRDLLHTVKVKSDTARVTLEPKHWQNLLDLQIRLAGYLRAIGQPQDPEM